MSKHIQAQLAEFILVQVRTLRHSENNELRAAAALKENELEKEIRELKAAPDANSH